MLGYTIRRLLIAIPILLLVLTIVFITVRVAPGDPARAVLGDYASDQAVQSLRERMGLNKPLLLQYVEFIGNLVRGDLGRSMINGTPVAGQIAQTLPYTLELTLSGIIFGVLIGVPLGMFTALRRNRLPDYLGRILSLAGLSFPTFYLGILLMLVFSVWLGWFPSVGGGGFDDIGSNLYHLVLPGLTLGLIMTSYVTRLSRSAILNILSEDYVNTARAKGLAERVVVYKHVLKNAMIPIISITGVYSIVLTGGGALVEIVFSRPGLGKLMIGAMLQRDYITLQTVIVIYALIVVIINLLTDLAYAVVDPRIKYD